MNAEQKLDAIARETDKLIAVAMRNFGPEDEIGLYLNIRLQRIRIIASTPEGMTPECLKPDANMALLMDAIHAAATFDVMKEIKR